MGASLKENNSLWQNLQRPCKINKYKVSAVQAISALFFLGAVVSINPVYMCEYSDLLHKFKIQSELSGFALHCHLALKSFVILSR